LVSNQIIGGTYGGYPEDLARETEILAQEDGRAGRFQGGAISVNYRKCGKKNCICAKPGHPGHGPQYLWSMTIKGKSYAKNLRFGPELKEYVEETDDYRGFVELCSELVELNERICVYSTAGSILIILFL